MKHALLFVFPLANLSRSSNVNWMEDGQKKTEETFVASGAAGVDGRR